MKKTKALNTIRSILCTLLALLLLIPVSACKGPISDSEAAEIASELLEKECFLTTYVYGDAFVLSDPAELEKHRYDSVYYYAKVSKNSPYTTKADLKAALEEVYTASVMEEINEFAFDGSNETEGVTIIPRFYESKEDGRLRIDVTTYGIYDLTAVILLDTISVKRSTRSMMEVSVDYRSGESGTVRNMEIKIIKQDGVWKLDTRTWAIAVEG